MSARTVVGRRDHRDGVLQLEYRANPRTGTRRGPYWDHKWREDGRQRTLYPGASYDPEAKLAKSKRAT